VTGSEGTFSGDAGDLVGRLKRSSFDDRPEPEPQCQAVYGGHAKHYERGECRCRFIAGHTGHHTDTPRMGGNWWADDECTPESRDELAAAARPSLLDMLQQRGREWMADAANPQFAQEYRECVAERASGLADAEEIALAWMLGEPMPERPAP
jgi:hypothetical protein